jgi:hypothetical protein
MLSSLARRSPPQAGEDGCLLYSVFSLLALCSLLLSPQNREPKARTNHENTKTGKHEKGPTVLYNPLFFRAFVPSCFRDCFRFFFCPLVSQQPSCCLPWPGVARRRLAKTAVYCILSSLFLLPALRTVLLALRSSIKQDADMYASCGLLKNVQIQGARNPEE